MGRDTSGKFEDGLNRRDDAVKLLALDEEVLAAGRRERVVTRAAVVIGHAPFGLDVAVEQETLKGGVERALPHLQDVVRQILYPLGYAVAVHGFSDERAEHQHVEGTGNEVRRFLECQRYLPSIVDVYPLIWRRCAAPEGR